MIVRCVKISGSSSVQTGDQNAWLTVGKAYVVLAVEQPAGKSPLYRIIGDDSSGKPTLFDSMCFEVEDGAPSAYWRTVETPAGTIKKAPDTWLQPGFWSDVFDGQPAALKQLQEMTDRILGEHSQDGE